MFRELRIVNGLCTRIYYAKFVNQTVFTRRTNCARVSLDEKENETTRLEYKYWFFIIQLRP